MIFFFQYFIRILIFPLFRRVRCKKSEGMVPVLTDLKKYIGSTPFFTRVVLIICIGAFIIPESWASPQDVCIDIRGVVERHEYFRALFALFFHFGSLRLVFTLHTARQSFRRLEEQLGTVGFCFLFVSMYLMVMVVNIVARYFVVYRLGKEVSCEYGLSGLLFAIDVLTSQAGIADRGPIFGVVDIPPKWRPFFFLIALHTVPNNSSLLGDLVGITTGLMASFADLSIFSSFRKVEAEILKRVGAVPGWIYCSGLGD